MGYSRRNSNTHTQTHFIADGLPSMTSQTLKQIFCLDQIFKIQCNYHNVTQDCVMSDEMQLLSDTKNKKEVTHEGTNNQVIKTI